MNESSSIVCDEARLLPPTPRAGDLIGGKYRLIRPLGEGGMGIVLEAEHVRLRQTVAIKFLRPDVLVLPDSIERFEREARAGCRMGGPHVVHVLDVDTDAHGRPYMVMELLRGKDLEAELQARGALPIPEAVDWVMQACAAVGDAHAAGIVHRDLKPSNLFLSEESGTRIVKVLDFGISKVTRDAEPEVTSSAITVGTPLYMSPEQVRSSRDVDARADVWSLGIILYELIAGTPPFRGTTTAAIAAIVADATPSLREARPEVSEELERAVMTALAKSPQNRFPSAEAFGAALVPFASAEGVAGPYSLRPSQEAFDMASSAMRRVPIARRARDASELLKLPTSQPTTPSRERRCTSGTLRTFAGTLVIGFGVASGAHMVTPGAHGRAGTRPPSGLAASAEAAAMLDRGVDAKGDPSLAIVLQRPDVSPLTAPTSAFHVLAPRRLAVQRREPRRPVPSLAAPSPVHAPRPAAADRSALRERVEEPHVAVDRPLYL